MQLVSLNNYTKDYKNGTITESIKFKPMTGAKGVTTVQLFNSETGELELETRSENVISDWIAQDGYDATFRRALASNSTQSGLFQSSFSVLAMSDAAVPESVSRREIAGRFVGWSTRETYSGNSVVRGTLNTAESWYANLNSTGKVQYHFVFDFPTQAANGTIRTIYWLPSRYTAFQGGGLENPIDPTSVAGIHGGVRKASNIWYWPYGTVNTNSLWSFEVQQANAYDFIGNVSNKFGRVDFSGNQFYGVRSYDSALSFAVVDIQRFNFSSADVVKLTYSDGTVMTSYPTALCAHIDATAQRIKVLFYNGNSTSFKDMNTPYTFYEFTFNFSGTYVEARSFSRDVLQNDAGAYPREYGGTNPWFYDDDGSIRGVLDWTITGTSPTQYVHSLVTMNGSLSGYSSIDMNQTLANLYNSYNGTSLSADSATIAQLTQTRVDATSTDCIYYTASNSGASGIISKSAPATVFYDNYDYNQYDNNFTLKYFNGTNLIGRFYTSGVQKGFQMTYPFGMWSAQNLLPNNITKTDVNTMKVQYDFIIDKPEMVVEFTANGGV